jgi:hypothetical protein
MRNRKFVVFASLGFALTFGFLTLCRMQAQDNAAPSNMASIDPYLMARDTEIEMARSAGPNSVSSGAKVLVLGRTFEHSDRGRHNRWHREGRVAHTRIRFAVLHVVKARVFECQRERTLASSRDVFLSTRSTLRPWDPTWGRRPVGPARRKKWTVTPQLTFR